MSHLPYPAKRRTRYAPLCLLALLCSVPPLQADTRWRKIAFADASAACPTGYVAVPSYTLPTGTFVPGFCVMQFEAQNGGNGMAVSNPGGTPWTNITFNQASSACNAAGARLISENEWLSLAHQITSVASNWTGGAVGSGVLFSGHNDNAPAAALSAPASATADCYTGTGDAASGSGDGAYTLFATNTINASPVAGQCRKHTLSNGAVLWDLAGNAWEMVGETIAKASRYHGGGATTMSYTSNDGAVSGTTYSVATAVPTNKLPKNGWNANQGMGRYYDGTSTSGANNSISEWPDSAGTGNVAPYAIFLRGGRWDAGAFAGVFALYLDIGRSFSNPGIGFRCTR